MTPRRSISSIKSVVFVTLAVMSLAASRAPASNIVRARRHFRSGKAAYAAGEYRRAIKEFLAGYRIAPKPAFLVNIAQSYRKAGEPREALLYFRTFLEVAPRSPMRKEVERLVEELEREEVAREQDEPGVQAKAITEPPPARPSAAPPPHLLSRPPAPPPRTPTSAPFYRRWWFWTAAVAVVAAGVGAGVYLGTRDGPREDASMGVVRW
jgi:tetratricopeptide (TPR) repeat protein